MTLIDPQINGNALTAGAVIVSTIAVSLVFIFWISNGSSSSSPSHSVVSPDLTISFDAPRPSLTWETFDATSCDVAEGSVTPGRHRLLRFATLLRNVGDAPLILGGPSDNQNLWEFSACHRHFHRKDVVNVRLLDSQGGLAAAGRKIAFCMQDMLPTHMPFGDLFRSAPRARFRNCDSLQGLTNGWTDVYGRDLDGNYVVITNVSAGEYTLEAEINALRPDETRPLPHETNFANNKVSLRVQITDSAFDILPPQVPNPTCATALSITNFGALILSNTFTGERVVGTDACGNTIRIGHTSDTTREGLILAKVWFTFVGTGVRMRASTCEEGTTLDTVLSIFTSPLDSCEELVCVTTNEDFNGVGCGFASKVDFLTVAGQRYWASVHGYRTDGAFGFTVDTVHTLLR